MSGFVMDGVGRVSSVSRETFDEDWVVCGSVDGGVVCFLVFTTTVIVEFFTILSYLFFAGVCSRIVS